MTIPVHLLRPADIIVSSADAKTSGMIRTGTGSSVSHAMVYIGNQYIVEAILSGGVVRRTLGRALGEATLAIALRRRNLTSKQAKAVVKYAEDFQKKVDYESRKSARIGLFVPREIFAPIHVIFKLAAYIKNIL